MTTQQILLSVLIFGTMNNIASAMDNRTNNNSSEEITFQMNLNKLHYHAANFILHFKTWPKEEQDKLTIYNSYAYRGYMTNGRPKASPLFNNNIILYLNEHLKKEDLIPFLEAMEYLKRQK